MGLGRGFREKRKARPSRDWLREFVGAASTGFDGDFAGDHEDDSGSDDELTTGVHGSYFANRDGVERDGGASGAGAFQSRDTFDSTTDAIYRASLASLTRSGRGGVYRDTGLGVGDVAFLFGVGNGNGDASGAYDGGAGAGAGGASALAAASFSKNVSINERSASGDASRGTSRGGFSREPSSTRGGAVGVSLREHVEAEARDTPSEAFAKYVRDMYRRVHRLIQSPEVAKRLAGVYAIDVLADAKIGETSNKMNRFASYLRDVFTVTCEPAVAEAAARAMGKMARVGGPLVAGIADREIKRCVGWLRADARVDAVSNNAGGTHEVGSGSGARRYAAVLVLRELAEHAPEVFNVHISSFIDAVWPALRDSRLFARQAAVRALRACLVVIERRETRYRVQWYYRLYEETQNGLKRDESGGAHAGGAVGSSAEVRLKSPSKTMNASASSRRALAPGSTVTPPGSVESQHGSLLAFGELLRHTGEFMLSRYKEVAETVLGLHESREKIVRRAVLELVPKLAAFSPKRFTESYLERSMRLLLSCLKNQAERDAGFTAIGDVAAALAAADEGEASAANANANDDASRDARGGTRASAGAYGSPGGSPRRAARSAASADASPFGDDRSSPNANASGLRFKGTGSATGHAPDEYPRSGSPSPGSARDRDESARETNRANLSVRTHRRAGSFSGFGFGGSLARIASGSNVHASGSSENLRRADHQKPLERYLPEIAAATRETCAAMEKAFAAAATAPPTKSGLRPAPAREPGAAEAFFCVGALARSVGAPWEPHARALVPFLFAGGLTAPLVAALASLAEALPRTAPSVQTRLVDAISEALAPSEIRVFGGNDSRGHGQSRGGVRAEDASTFPAFPKVQRAELVGRARRAGDEAYRTRAPDGSRSELANGEFRSTLPASPLGSAGSFSKLRRVFSSALLGDGEPETRSHGESRLRHGETLEPNGVTIESPSTPRFGVSSFSNLKPAFVATPATPTVDRRPSTPGSPGKQGAKKKANDRKADERDAAALKFHRARVQLALRTLGTFPFFGGAGSVSLGYARKRVVEFLDDDDAATRREAALACCRLLDSGSTIPRGEAFANGGFANGEARANGSPRKESSLTRICARHDGVVSPTSPSLPKPLSAGWSASVEEFIVSRLLAVAVSDLDAGVRKAVLASFCKPSAATDGHLAQAESLRVLFVALNDENAEVRLIAIRLVGRLAPRNPAYALPALRRHLLQLIAELEHSAESHIRTESARLIATLTRAVPRLVAPYIAPVLRALIAKLRTHDAGAKAVARNAKAGARRDEPAAARDAAAAAAARGEAEGGDAGDGRAVAAAGANAEAAAGAAGGAADGRNVFEIENSTGVGGGALGAAAADGAGAPGASTRRDDVLGGVPGVSAGAAKNASASASSGVGASSAAQSRKSREGAAVPAKERAAALGAVGEIAQVGAEGVSSYAEAILPLIVDGVRSGATRAAAIVALGQWVEATGSAVRPFAEHPHLLRLLLRVLAEESGETRAQTLRTLGVLGALDPLTHKDNEERLHGQGLLSMEGVRGVGRDEAEDEETFSKTRETDRADAGVFQNLDTQNSATSDERLSRGGKRVHRGGAAVEGYLDDDGGDDGDDDGGVGSGDPIPTRHLTTASDAFYPSTALNALLRVLRDPSASSRHHAVTRSVMYIFRALGRDCVPYLPATVPVLLRVIRECEDGSREFMYAQLARLVDIVRGHVRLYLDDIFDVIRRFWGPGPLLRQSLRLLESIAAALHDDFRRYLPDFLQRIVGVLADAERSGEHEAVPATLRALESFGSAADEHIHLALPALVRLFRPKAAASVPTAIRARTLRSLATLLPRAQLAGHASAVAHPLLRVLDGEEDALRLPALAALAAMATALRDDFALFVPMTRRVMAKRNVRDPVFERVAEDVLRRTAILNGTAERSNVSSALMNDGATLPPLATATSGGALPDAPGAIFENPTRAFANLALRASREAEAMREPDLSLSRPGGGLAGGRSRTPGAEYAAGDSLYRGGSGRGEGSHYGGRSPELDPNAFSPLQHASGGLSPLDFAGGSGSFTVDEFALRRAWDSSSRSTKEDWLEWMRHVSVEMLRQSPSPALRACLELASTRPRTARDLFCASFASCWSGLSQNGRDALVRALESAFGAPTIPPEIVGTLLNLAEFCEHDERPLPVEARTLGAIAERCRAYAKALHYKETEFVTSPAACVEAIIAINNRLQLPEAAMGVLVYAQAHLRLEIKEGWYEKLGQWENALDAHRRKAAAAETAARDAALEATASYVDIGDSRLGKASGASDKEPFFQTGRGGSVGRRRGGSGSEASESGSRRGDPRTSTGQHSSVARKRLAARAGEAAAEARREASLGQMRCLAALAEWEALGRLCAREWDASGTPVSANDTRFETSESPESPETPSSPPKARASADAAMRARMAPLATQAAWHLGDWRRMETYCASIPNLSGDQSDNLRDQAHGHGSYVSRGLARSTSEDGFASGALAETEEDSVTSGLAGGGFARVDVAFFKAVLATRRGDAEEARARVRVAREHLGKELAALVTESYDRSYGGMVRAQQLTELEEVLEYAELGRVVAASETQTRSGADDADGARRCLGRFAETANVGDVRSARTRRSLIRDAWRERIYGAQRNVEVWQALLAVRSLALPAREETETWLKFASLNRKAGRARQAHRTLLRLLEYDPSRCAPGSPGYGAGSGQPDVMLAYVKHQWALGNRRDAFARLQSLVGELRYAVAGLRTDLSRVSLAFFFARGFVFCFVFYVRTASFATNALETRARMMISPKIDGAAEPDTRVAARSLRAFMS